MAGAKRLQGNENGEWTEAVGAVLTIIAVADQWCLDKDWEKGGGDGGWDGTWMGPVGDGNPMIRLASFFGCNEREEYEEQGVMALFCLQ